MAYRRLYSLTEIKGMLQMYRGNKMMIGTVPGTIRVARATAAAHPDFHAGASLLDQRARVNTPGEPRTTGTYWNDEDQANATMDLLNGAMGQIMLATLDGGQKSGVVETGLPANKYKISVAKDNSANVGPGQLVRNDPGRIGQGSSETVSFATSGFVKVVAGVGGTLQVQTSYPIA